MTRDNRQILVNPHSSQEKIPAGALNLGEIGVQHNNVEDAALYVETVADSQSASTVAKFITEKAIDTKIETAVSGVISTLQTEIDGINEAVGLPHEESGATPWGTGATVWDAIETVYAEMTAGTAAANTKVITNDNKDTEDYMTLSAESDPVTSSITYTIGLKGINDALDTLDQAITTEIANREEAIAGLEFSGVTREGKPVIDVTQTDGVVNAETGSIDAKFVDVTVNSATTPLDEVIEDILENISANKVKSEDGSVVITTGAGETDLSVNIDGVTIVKDGGGVLSVDLKLSAITPSSANVKEEFALIDNEGNQLGDTVKIYKDSSLNNVYVGHVDDTLSDPTDPTSIVAGSGDTALCFIYEKTDGTYKLVAINVEDFLQESEFADGLVVEDHVVSVLVDPNSQEVVVGNSGETAPVLTVSADGVKVDNIQNAIDYAVDSLAADVDEELNAINEAIEAIEEKLNKTSVEEGTSVENFVTLNVTNNGEGATAITIDDSELKQTIDFIYDDITNEAVAREEGDAALLGTSADTTSANTIMGIKNLIAQITLNTVKDITVSTGETLLDVTKEDTEEGDLYTISSTQRLNDAVELAEASIQEVGFAAVATKDETVYGSNAGAELVDINNGGKKLNLDLSLLKIDCGEY